MQYKKISDFISAWLDSYCEKARLDGFIVGVSGGIDSAVTATLCARTGRKTILVTLPIRQRSEELLYAQKQIKQLAEAHPNVIPMEIHLTDVFHAFKSVVPVEAQEDQLAMANSRARLRMTTLYAIGQANRCLVAGTGNKVEDFGVGFFTKYGDGGVDISPIADVNKTQVKELAKVLNVIPEILAAKPTDGLWEDGRCDEDQLGASYPELEWAMEYEGDESLLNPHQKTVLAIYRKFHSANKHKMEPIPVCLIPDNLK